MNKLFVLLMLSLFLVPFASYARDDIWSYSIKEALDLEQSKSRLGENIKFYFGDQTHGEVVKNYGEFRTKQVTNAFNKTDLQACEWVFLSAMIALMDKAVSVGGNAVINIKFNYKNNLISSKDTFQCGTGTFVAGVALVGTVVKLNQ